MIPIYPAFTIVGQSLGLMLNNLWDNGPDKMKAVWECLNCQYNAHAAYVGSGKTKEVMLVFDTEADELAFRLRFGL